MQLYFAPLEGITGYIYRGAHHQFYTGVDLYYAPFISPAQGCVMNPKEMRDVIPEHNAGVPLVPQILAKDAKFFIQAAKMLREFGYSEINLNAGCPSRTVVTKGKGAGFLQNTDALDRFLDTVMEELGGDISVKTRIGMREEEEFERLLAVYNRYPLKMLIIHPRTGQDFYEHEPRYRAVEYALRNSKNPICYNGDIFDEEAYKKLRERFPKLERVMLGRGMLQRPCLAEQLTKEEASVAGEGKDRADKEATLAEEGQEMEGKAAGREEIVRLRAFHDRLAADYTEYMSGDKNVLFKMKELWLYMLACIPEGERYRKDIKKVQKLSRYHDLMERMFTEALS